MQQPTEQANPYAPPQSKVERAASVKQRSSKLMSHEKAGRVIRLMAVLGMVGVAAMGVAILLPALSMDQPLPMALVVMLLVLFALAVGLFFVGRAVMRHESWARTLGILYGAISLLGFPIGTLIGAYVLWQLVFRWGEVAAEA